MAFINNRKAKEILSALKAKYQNVKFDFEVWDMESLTIIIKESPFFYSGQSFSVYQYDLNCPETMADIGCNKQAEEFLLEVLENVRTVGQWYDNTDVLKDHFDTAFYIHLQVGQQGRPHQNIAA